MPKSEKKSEKVSFAMPIVPKTETSLAITKPLLHQAAEYKITSEDHFVAAWPLVQAHDAALEKIDAIWDPFVSGLHSMHKAAIKMRDTFRKPIADSKERLLRIRMIWRNEQEAADRRRRELEAENARKAEAAALLRDAKKLEKSGQGESAELLRQQAAVLPAVIAPPPAAPVPKQSGSVVRERIVCTIENPDLVPRELCDPTMSRIQKAAEATDGKVPIPGVRIEKVKAEHSRAV